MNMKLYQIKMDRDKDKVAFLSLDSYTKQTGKTEIDSDIYDCVFEGGLQDGSTLEDLFMIFNDPINMNNLFRCMSVSDVVEITDSKGIENGYYYCDSIGFKKVKFGSGTNGTRIAKHGDPERAKKASMESFRFCCDICRCEFYTKEKSVISICFSHQKFSEPYMIPYICRVSQCPECGSWVTQNNWND